MNKLIGPFVTILTGYIISAVLGIDGYAVVTVMAAALFLIYWVVWAKNRRRK